MAVCPPSNGTRNTGHALRQSRAPVAAVSRGQQRVPAQSGDLDGPAGRRVTASVRRMSGRLFPARTRRAARGPRPSPGTTAHPARGAGAGRAATASGLGRETGLRPTRTGTVISTSPARTGDELERGITPRLQAHAPPGTHRSLGRAALPATSCAAQGPVPSRR